jgi:MFS family permease
MQGSYGAPLDLANRFPRERRSCRDVGPKCELLCYDVRLTEVNRPAQRSLPRAVVLIAVRPRGGPPGAAPIESDRAHAYDRVFWLAYLSNGVTTLANAMLVRYSDFVVQLGGEERQLGLIVGCGMAGSVAVRMVQGESIDRWGAGRVWRLSILLYCASLIAHLMLRSAYSPSIFLARTLMQASLAGMFGSSITFVSLRVPPPRLAEIVGALGTSGFLGILFGPLISDLLSLRGGRGAGIGSSAGVGAGLASGGMWAGPRVGWTSAEWMFVVAAGFAVVAAVTAWWATSGEPPPRPRRRPHFLQVMRRYFPFALAAASAAMGAGFSIPMTFLRPFSVEHGLGGVGLFFAVYAAIAFVARVLSRSLFERHGNRPWILVGLGLLTASYLAYLPVVRTWQLAFPAALAGTAHALLFPSIMAAGTSAFPRRYLGVATSFMLAMFDLGTLLSSPLVGALLYTAKAVGWPAYEVAFGAAAATLGLTTLLVVRGTRPRCDPP